MFYYFHFTCIPPSFVELLITDYVYLRAVFKSVLLEITNYKDLRFVSARLLNYLGKSHIWWCLLEIIKYPLPQKQE